MTPTTRSKFIAFAPRAKQLAEMLGDNRPVCGGTHTPLYASDFEELAEWLVEDEVRHVRKENLQDQEHT